MARGVPIIVYIVIQDNISSSQVAVMKKILLLLTCFLSMLLQAQIQGNITGPELQSDLSAQQSMLASIKSKGNELKDLYSQLRSVNEAMASLKQQQEKAQREIELLSKKAGRTEAESNRLAQLIEELAQINSKIEQANRNIEKLQQQISKISSEINALDDAMDRLEQKIANEAIKEKSKGKESRKIDSVINAATISFYRRAAKLLQADPAIRVGLTAAAIKTLTTLENKYKSDNIFRNAVDKETRLLLNEKADQDSKDASEAARDRKKAAMDALQKYLDIIKSMNPQI